jgi:hypothetical protein
MSETLLAEFLEGVREMQDRTGVRKPIFTRSLSRAELEAIEELGTIGSGIE